MKVTERKMVLTISSYKTAKKVFLPVRMKGKNCLKTQSYEPVKENGKQVSQITGRASVMVMMKPPIHFSYNRHQEIAVISRYGQRYDANNFAIDLSLQKMIS